MNAQLSADQSTVGAAVAGVAIAPGMTRCEWCSNVYDIAGKLVDPRPANWGTIPHKVCAMCERIERMAKRQAEVQERMPMTREELANAGVVRKGKKIISVRRTMEAVSAGRSCLPPEDRD